MAAPPAACSLVIQVAAGDLPFMMHTVPHLVRACAYPFAERLLLVAGGSRRRRAGAGTGPKPGTAVASTRADAHAALHDACERLRAEGWIDRVVPLDYSDAYRRRVFGRCLTRVVRHWPDKRGDAILGNAVALEETNGDYVLRFDSDMLLHQARGYDWIGAGIALMREHPEVLCVLPRSGPPSPDGALYGQRHAHRQGPGFFRFQAFTTRVYLLHRRRFEALLPLDVRPGRSWRGRAAAWLGRARPPSWERMVSRRLEETGRVRADLDTPHAWSMHPPRHDASFVAALPGLIERVEAGRVPSGQAGYYDLKLELFSPAGGAT